MSNSAGMLRAIQPLCAAAGADVGASVGYCATELRRELDRAGRLTHTLSALASRVTTREPLFVWLFGRDEEVRTVVGSILSDWSEGLIQAEVAACRMRAYLDELEESLDQRFRRRAGASAGAPARTRLLRRTSDTVAGVPEDRSTMPSLSDETRKTTTS